MANKLSHSAVSKFQTCGQAYKLHYVDKIREKTRSGALVFGSALDNALNYLLNNKDKDENAVILEETINVFIEAFKHSDINGEKIYVPTCEEIVYATSDADLELLSNEILEEINTFTTNNFKSNDCVTLYDDILEQKKLKGWKNLTSEQRQVYNYINWWCLYQKGIFMLAAYNKEILPKITRMISVQEKLEIQNNDGDTLVAYIDAVVEWEDGRIIVLDHKTSTREYGQDSVLYSPQMILYSSLLKEKYETTTAGFVVMYKAIQKNKKKTCIVCSTKAPKGSRLKKCDVKVNKKRCNGEFDVEMSPKARIEYIISDIPETSSNIVLENFDAINRQIKDGHFTKNFNACRNWFGGDCPYLKACWSNDFSDLEDVSRKKK